MTRFTMLHPTVLLARAHQHLAPRMYTPGIQAKGRPSTVRTGWQNVDERILASRCNFRLAQTFGDLSASHPGWLATHLVTSSRPGIRAAGQNIGIGIVTWLGALAGLAVRAAYWSLAHFFGLCLPPRWQLGDGDSLPLIKLEAAPEEFRHNFLELHVARARKFERTLNLYPDKSLLSQEFLDHFAAHSASIELHTQAHDSQHSVSLLPQATGPTVSPKEHDALAATWCRWMEILNCEDATLWASTLASEITPHTALESFVWAVPDYTKDQDMSFVVDRRATRSIFYSSTSGAQFCSTSVLEHVVDPKGKKIAKLISPATFRAVFDVQNMNAPRLLSLKQNGAETIWGA